MKPDKLTCPNAKYRDEMRIYCEKAEDYCGNAYFLRCKGWWALTEGADRCPLRKERKHGKQNATAADHRDAV